VASQTKRQPQLALAGEGAGPGSVAFSQDEAGQPGPQRTKVPLLPCFLVPSAKTPGDSYLQQNSAQFRAQGRLPHAAAGHWPEAGGPSQEDRLPVLPACLPQSALGSHWKTEAVTTRSLTLWSGHRQT
jgi:hypothetical protein